MSSNIENKSEFINALKQNFTTTLRKVFINSLNKEVAFREITVKEQKTISRIMIDNEDRKDIVYDAQCALINSCCLDESFDIYQLTDFDKTKLLMFLYQTNMFKSTVDFTCPECGTQNQYKFDFTQVLEKLDKIDLSDKQFTFKNNTWQFDFTLNYPSVKLISDYYKTFSNKYKNLNKKEIDALNTLLNIDYTLLFIKQVVITKLEDNSVKTVNSNDFTAAEFLEILSLFPLDVLYVDNGIIAFIIKEFIKNVEKAYEQHKCGICGAVYKNSLDNSTTGFF